jgi:predicted TPR repeat methyltransferase
MADKPQGRLAQVSGADVNIDPAEHYDGWADTYDEDLVKEYGYCAPEIAVEAFAGEFPQNGGAIIDVGCGTGLVGIELAQRGYSDIDGVDISEGMLAKARATGVYRALITQDIEKPSAVPQASYDAVISVGSFGLGHLGPEAIPGLIAMARPGGLIVIFMNAEPYGLDGYAAHIRALETDGVWTVTRIEDHNYMRSLDRPGKLIVARRG